MFNLIKTLLKTAVVGTIAVLAAAHFEWNGTRLTRHAERIVDAVLGTRSPETLQKETVERASTLMKDAREGAASLEKLKQNEELAREAAKKAGKVAEDLDRITTEHQKQLRELIEEKTGK